MRNRNTTTISVHRINVLLLSEYHLIQIRRFTVQHRHNHNHSLSCCKIPIYTRSFPTRAGSLCNRHLKVILGNQIRIDSFAENHDPDTPHAPVVRMNILESRPSLWSGSWAPVVLSPTVSLTLKSRAILHQHPCLSLHLRKPLRQPLVKTSPDLQE